MREARTVGFLARLLRPYAWTLPAIVILGIFSSLAESIGLSLFVPLLESLNGGNAQIGGPDRLQRFFDFVLARLPVGHRLSYIAFLILAMTTGKALLTYGHSALVAVMNARVTHSLRSRVFSKAIGISQTSLDQAGSGRLINLLATNTWHTSDAIATLIGLVISLSSILVFSLLLLALSWQLTLIVALGVAVLSLTLRSITRGAHRLGRESVEANSILSNQMLDALEGIREIQMFSLSAFLEKRFEMVSERVRLIHLRLDLLHRAISPLSEMLYIGLLILLLLLGVRSGSSTPTIVVFLLVLYRLQPQVKQLDSARLNLVSLTSAVEEVVRFLDSEVATPSRTVGMPDGRLCDRIEFDNVGFDYGSGLVVRDISFSICAGETTAVVGPSGSGKTTLVSLLTRFYETSLGEIRVDDEPLSRIDIDAWRAQIAWVSQDAYIFSATIAENIRYGRLDATDAEVTKAAVEADADDFIRQLPNGYNTAIGNSGVRLSSGQVQRIALARAFVRRPSILILDEATNALDSISEEAIRSALKKVRGVQTVILISHRLSTVRHADRVIVMSHGRIAEQGEPRELLARHGLLRKIRELQYVD